MVFLDACGKIDDFYELNSGIDAIWRNLRGIETLSTRELTRVRDKSEEYQRRLEVVQGEAAEFAADAIEISSNAIQCFLSGEIELAFECSASLIDLASQIAEFLAEYDSDGDYQNPFSSGDVEADRILKGVNNDIESLLNAGEGDLTSMGTKFMRRSGTDNLHLKEIMQMVIVVDKRRI
jgi:hypothetical protein